MIKFKDYYYFKTFCENNNINENYISEFLTKVAKKYGVPLK